MIITYNNTLRNTEEKLHKIRPVILELAESQVDLKHLHGILQELADATAPIEQRGKRNFDRKKKNEVLPVSSKKSLPSEKPVVQSKGINHRKGNHLTPKTPKDSMDILLDDLLDAEDFPGIRAALHDLGYAIPTSFPNNLEIPEEWDLWEYDDYHDLFGMGIEPLAEKEEAVPSTTEEVLIPLLEFGIRKQKTSLIRAILMALGFEVTYKKNHPKKYPDGPELM